MSDKVMERGEVLERIRAEAGAWRDCADGHCREVLRLKLAGHSGYGKDERDALSCARNAARFDQLAITHSFYPEQQWAAFVRLRAVVAAPAKPSLYNDPDAPTTTVFGLGSVLAQRDAAVASTGGHGPRPKPFMTEEDLPRGDRVGG